MHRTENQVERASDHLIEVLLCEEFGQASPPDLSERILAQIAVDNQATRLSLRRVSSSRQGYWTWLLSAAAIGILCVIGYSISHPDQVPTQAQGKPTNDQLSATQIEIPVPKSTPLEAVAPDEKISVSPIGKGASEQQTALVRDPVKLELPLDTLPFGDPFQERGGQKEVVKSESQKTRRDRPVQLTDQQIVADIDELLVALWRSSGFDASSTKSSEAHWLERLRQIGAVSASSAVTPSEPLPSVRKQALALADRWLRLLLPDESLKKLSADRKTILVKSLAKSFAGEIPWDVQIEQLFGVDLTTNASLPTPVANDSGFLASLGSPHSTNVVDQAGRVLFNEDLACARCHDHPLKSHVSQIDYWSIAAIFQNDLRWYEQDGVVHVAGQSPESVPAALFYDTFDGRTRVASPRLPRADGNAGDEANVRNLISGAEQSGALAQTATNLLWRLVFKRPLVGAIADPESPPLEPPLEAIHRLLSEQLVAHDYDLGQALGWILQPVRCEASTHNWRGSNFLQLLNLSWQIAVRVCLSTSRLRARIPR